MRRRTFIQTLPLAAAGSAASVQSKAAGLGQRGPAQTNDQPKFQPTGAERFIRSDVHTGDRPSGASFATRSPALGLNGAAGTAHPLATQTAIAMLKRGGSAVDAAVAANAVLGFVEPVSSGLGGDCFAFVWDPKAAKLMGMAGSGRSPKFPRSSLPGVPMRKVPARINRMPSAQLAGVPKMVSTPEIRVDCPDDIKFDLVQRVAAHFKSRYKTIDIDGVRVIFPEGWGLLRASNTQPVLVMRFEAANEHLLRQYQSEVEQVLEASRAGAPVS